jgi:hypothetical protein
MKKIFLKICSVAMVLTILSSCEKEYLQTAPTGSVPSEGVFTTTDGALVALNGTYRYMWNSLGGSHGHFGQKAVDLTMDLMSNDMAIQGTSYGWFNTENRLTAQLSPAAGTRSALTWEYYFRVINNANIIIKNIDATTGPAADKENIKGQALALRAYNYFYLVNLFQHTYKGNETKPGVPVYTEPIITGNSRGTVAAVYTQIIADLKAAETLLAGKSRKQFAHINQATVKGIYARVALQMEDWSTAATKAAEARTSFPLMSNAQYTSGFSVRNGEWIWGLEIPNDQATIFASFFSHFDANTLSYASLGMQKKITKDLYDKIPAADVRKSTFRTPGTAISAFPDYSQNKFRLPTSGSWAADYILLRSSEMYLIEAEANARLGDAGKAITALESLIKPRNAAYVAPSTASALITEALLQRRIELWGEGFSLLDLKRLKLPLNRASGTGNHVAAIAVIFTLPAGDKDWLFRIPQSEIDASDAINPEDQNP